MLALDTQGHLSVLVREIFAPLAEGLTFSGLKDVIYTVFLKKPNIFLSLFLVSAMTLSVDSMPPTEIR